MATTQQWLIIGAHSSIARAFARIAASHGHDMILAGRHPAELARMAADLTIRHGITCKTNGFDMNEPEHYAELMQLCQDPEKTTHIFLAAGILFSEAHLSDAHVQQMLQTNFVSPIMFLHRWIHDFEGTTGSILVLGSVAGDRGRARNAIYGASKGGLETYLEGFSAAAAQKKIHVSLIKPGPIDTQMVFHLAMPLLISPETCAKACWKNGFIKQQRIVYTPKIWRYIMGIVRHIPFFVFKHIKK